MLAIRLPSDLEERLETLAKATGRTKTFYAREAIAAHLDNWKTSILQSNACWTTAPADLTLFHWKT